MSWWERWNKNAWVFRIEYGLLYFWVENIEGIPSAAVVVNEPRLFFGDIAKAFVLKTVKIRVMMSIFQIPFGQFNLKRSNKKPSSPISMLFFNDEWVHGPTWPFFRFLPVRYKSKVDLIESLVVDLFREAVKFIIESVVVHDPSIDL